MTAAMNVGRALRGGAHGGIGLPSAGCPPLADGLAIRNTK